MTAPVWEERPLAEAWWPEDWGAAPGWATTHAADQLGLDLPVAEGWAAVGASRRGRLHAHRGAAREDGLALRRAGRALVAAVADGAGSKPRSRLGAALAAETATATLAALGDGPVDEARLRAALGDALRAAEEALTGLAAAQGVPASDLRTTLLLAVLVDGWLGAAQIGDGSVAVEEADGRVALLTGGDGGEFAGEVSHFLPDAGAVDRALARLVLRPLGDARSLLLCSDGVDDCFYPLATMGPLLLAQLREGVTEGAPGFVQRPGGPVLRAERPSEALLAWLGYEKRGENDDRTLALCWRPEAG
jgi:serine/threonine protein phosphatase PrpC